MKIKIIDGDFTVCKVRDYSETDLNAEYCFTGKTDNENSLVCKTDDVPLNAIAGEPGWKAFRIDEILDFSLTGILARISALLADQKIGIFAVSTYNTDYIFVKEADFAKALTTLADAGYEII